MIVVRDSGDLRLLRCCLSALVEQNYTHVHLARALSAGTSDALGGSLRSHAYGSVAMDAHVGEPQLLQSEKLEVLLGGVGTLRYLSPPNASAQWQPGDLTIHTNKWSLGAGFLGSPPIYLIQP